MGKSLSSVVEGVKNSYIKYEHIKNLDIQDLNIVRIEVISSLTSIENRIKSVTEHGGNIRPLTDVMVNYKRVLSTVKGLISSKNVVAQEELAGIRKKLAVATSKNKELEAVISMYKIKEVQLAEKIAQHKEEYQKLLCTYVND